MAEYDEDDDDLTERRIRRRDRRKQPTPWGEITKFVLTTVSMMGTLIYAWTSLQSQVSLNASSIDYMEKTMTVTDARQAARDARQDQALEKQGDEIKELLRDIRSELKGGR